MWIFRVKRPPSSPRVFKARYVARGFSQRQGVDFFQTFSPTPKMATLRVLLHVAAQRDYELHSLDFSTAFLQGSLHEDIWLRRPPGFTGSFPAGTQWSLRRPVYGLRQAPRKWHNTLRMTLVALGLAPSTADPSLFLRTDTSLSPFYILVYVDDLVFATADTEAPTLVLQRFGFRYSSPQSSPLPTGHSLSASSSDESVELSDPYPELVGCLMSPLVGGVVGTDAGGAGTGGAGSGGALQSLPRRPIFLEQPSSLLPEPTPTCTTPLLFPLPDSPLPAPAQYVPLSISLTGRREPVSCAASPAPSRVTREPVVLPLPPPSSLPSVPGPVSDLAHAARPTIPYCLAALVTVPASLPAAALPLLTAVPTLLPAHRPLAPHTPLFCCLRRPTSARPAGRHSRAPPCLALRAALLVARHLALPAMASLSVLTFDHEGRPIQFNTWLDVLQLYLLSDSRDSVSLFDHTSGASLAPPTTANSATCSQWLTRDAAACLAVRNHLPLAKRAHFG
ncbi:unnamed protein product [Closterium sp. NIES-54]